MTADGVRSTMLMRKFSLIKDYVLGDEHPSTRGETFISCVEGCTLEKYILLTEVAACERYRVSTMESWHTQRP